MTQIRTDFVPHTYHDLCSSYERRRLLIASMSNAHHRKIARNYLLHSMLEVAGRYKEILAPELSVPNPVYIFHHNDIEYQGHDEVAGFYHGLTESGANVIVTTEHRMAVADWGFGLEQISHFNRQGEAIEKLGLPPLPSGDIYVEHRHTMRIWPYTADGRMLGETLYYAHEATYSPIPGERALTPEGAAKALAHLIEVARQDFFSECA
jgi:hypothetical protein